MAFIEINTIQALLFFVFRNKERVHSENTAEKSKSPSNQRFQ
jgi:hypothetical protein